ncbi:hypothetical protein B0T19DRAFT_415509 [Cercophora scortea]|uniref:Protein kinase domain-containing protein n=1 Tax=Cercophora scortea TaxID=314031 RepID=A0AAE0IWK6_9PEZI|nr:hypothetical protein B0T19DRAFT_415509 [Cercophora scortea]
MGEETEFRFTRRRPRQPEFLGNYLPNRVLWSLFDCLVKGCIAMEYPPRMTEAGTWAASGGDFGHPFSETIPPQDAQGNDPPGTGMVHFDIDPGNVFVGGFQYGVRAALIQNDPDGHREVPIFKLGDFGTSHDVTPANLIDEAFIWRRRHVFKNGFATPEQFTREWDYLTSTPAEYTHRTHIPVTIAGRYGPKTNIFQIAMIMYEAITLTRAPQQPLATVIPGQPRRVTYGGHLDHPDYALVDPALRDLVKECLYECPDHRPSLRELQTAINIVLNGPMPEGNNTMPILDWWAMVVGDPPEMKTPYVRYVNDLDTWIQQGFPMAQNQIPRLHRNIY